MQLNIKLYGTPTPLLLSIQLNFKPYLRMRLWYIIVTVKRLTVAPNLVRMPLI
jgi:hypothetical protein